MQDPGPPTNGEGLDSKQKQEAEVGCCLMLNIARLTVKLQKSNKDRASRSVSSRLVDQIFLRGNHTTIRA